MPNFGCLSFDTLLMRGMMTNCWAIVPVEKEIDDTGFVARRDARVTQGYSWVAFYDDDPGADWCLVITGGIDFTALKNDPGVDVLFEEYDDIKNLESKPDWVKESLVTLKSRMTKYGYKFEGLDETSTKADFLRYIGKKFQPWFDVDKGRVR